VVRENSNSGSKHYKIRVPDKKRKETSSKALNKKKEEERKKTLL